MNKLVETSGLVKNYQIDNREIKVIRGIDLVLMSSETVAVVGPSGAGKSTLLHLIGLLEAPSSGGLFFEGQDIREMTNQQRAQFRLEKIGFVFQFHHLLPEFSALENVMMPGLMREDDKEDCRGRANDLLNRVGLEDRVKHKPGELSGGEQQRTALARALMNQPRLIMADEPTGNLDRKASGMLRNLLWDICSDHGSTLLLVTHDESLSNESDRVLRMVDGQFEDTG
ncbi:MAG: ABC transporter ATP-binding protein [Candidatus Electryoneaceae bacterium]|nr:ABC transporter ATP-binding protein [Candidatus Electryoneaceae bacterium]